MQAGAYDYPAAPAQSFPTAYDLNYNFLPETAAPPPTNLMPLPTTSTLYSNTMVCTSLISSLFLLFAVLLYSTLFQ